VTENSDASSKIGIEKNIYYDAVETSSKILSKVSRKSSTRSTSDSIWKRCVRMHCRPKDAFTLPRLNSAQLKWTTFERIHNCKLPVQSSPLLLSWVVQFGCVNRS